MLNIIDRCYAKFENEDRAMLYFFECIIFVIGHKNDRYPNLLGTRYGVCWLEIPFEK